MGNETTTCEVCGADDATAVARCNHGNPGIRHYRASQNAHLVSDPHGKAVPAALLNLIPIPFPVGYAYLGRRWRFSIVTFLRSFALLIGIVLGIGSGMACGMSQMNWTVGLEILIPYAIVVGLTAVDALVLAMFWPVRPKAFEDDVRSKTGARPWVAAGLNFITYLYLIPLPFGYAVLGCKRRFWTMTGINLLLLVVVMSAPEFISYGNTFAFLLLQGLIAVLLAVFTYRTGKRLSIEQASG